MRNELKPLEGDLVLVLGRAKEARRKNGQLHVMLTRPTLRLWDGQAPVQQGKSIQTDHLWVQCPVDEWGGEMLEVKQGIGRVTYYQRADGTVDLGVALCSGLNFDRLACAWIEILGTDMRQSSVKHVLEGLTETLEELKTQGRDDRYVYSYYCSLPEMIKRVERMQGWVKASVEATEKALQSGKAKGHKPRGLGLPLRNCRKTAAYRHV